MAIIGIIGSIAYPSFNDYRKNAARTASDTSAGNMAKAFKTCTVLKEFGQCKSMDNLRMTCPSGSTCKVDGQSPNFCAHIKRGTPNQDDFNVCISINQTTGKEVRLYGGALLADKEIVHITETDAGTPANCKARNGGNEFALTPIEDCDPATISTSHPTVQSSTNDCGKSYTCKKPTSAGTCTSTGLCI